ncbi:DUF5068 domain-containing protein [Virgibacillus oceani]
MQKRGFVLFVSLILSVLLITGCGSDEEEEATVDATEEEDTEEEVNDDEEVVEADEEEIESSEEFEGGFSELISYMEETTEGTANVLYENDDAQSHEMDGLTVTLDSYTLVELNDFHTNFNIPFDEENDGALIIAQYTVKNDTDDDLHYMPHLDVTYVGAEKNIGNHRNILPEEQQLPVILSPDNDYTVNAGEEVTGYYTYPFGETRFADVLDVGSVDVQVPTPQTDPEDFSSTIGSEGRFTISLDEEGTAEQEETANEGFYEDKVTADNMGDKTMIESEEGIGDTEELSNSTITLEGYQFTAFEPNADEAPRFENFTEGIVLLTVKFLIDNGEGADISKTSMTSRLDLNDGQQWTLNEGMLLNYDYNSAIESGEEGELLQVYPLDKEQYDLIWQDKSFEIEIGPLRDMEAEDISKGQEATFQLK